MSGPSRLQRALSPNPASEVPNTSGRTNGRKEKSSSSVSRNANPTGGNTFEDSSAVFIIDNSSLKADTPSLQFRSRKVLGALSQQSIGWGEQIVGKDEGDGWVRTDRGFLPKMIRECTVVVPHGKVVPHAPDTPSSSKSPPLEPQAQTPDCPVRLMFKLLVRTLGGPGKTAMEMITVVEETISKDQLDEEDLAIVKQCAYIADMMMGEPQGQYQELVDVVKRVLVCIIKGCSKLPPDARTVCIWPLVVLSSQNSLLLESGNQLWDFVLNCSDLSQSEIYAAGALADHYMRRLCQQQQLAGLTDDVQQQIESMIGAMITAQTSCRFHFTYLAENSRLEDDALPDCAKSAIQKEKRAVACPPSRRGVASSATPRNGGKRAKRRKMLEHFMKMRSLAHVPDEEDSGHEDWKDMDEIDSKSSEEESDMGEDMGEFIDFDPEMNNYGIIDLADLPSSSKELKQTSGSDSPAGLLAFLKKVNQRPGAKKDEVFKQMEAFLKTAPQQGWHEIVRDLMQRPRSTTPTAVPEKTRRLS